MKFLIAAAIGLASLAMAPASAVTFRAITAFTPSSATSGPFTFGSVSAGAFTAYPTGGDCLLSNTICLTAGGYLGVYKSFDGAAHPHSDTVDVPADALLFHPGSGNEIASVFFTAPTAGTYYIRVNAFQATNTSPNSVDLIGFNGFGTSGDTLATLTALSPTYLVNTSIALAAGQSIGFGVGNAGNYQFDATGVNFTISSGPIPEPATWILMIGGFGLVGAAMRRRTVAAAV